MDYVQRLGNNLDSLTLTLDGRYQCSIKIGVYFEHFLADTPEQACDMAFKYLQEHKQDTVYIQGTY